MATWSRMMKKAASSIIPLANRSIHPRNYTSAMFTTPLKTSTTSNSTANLFRSTLIQTHHHFSAPAEKKSNSNDSILSVIESDIGCAEENYRKVVEASRDQFPFKIDDNAGEYWTSITLTREYQGEKIKVRVQKPPCHYGDSRGKEESDSQNIYLHVTVSNNSGLTLRFDITADGDRITITWLDVKYPNSFQEVVPFSDKPEFWNLDKNVQEAFYKYLEDRGIEPNICKFLCDYMARKKYKKFTPWLKYVKKFLAN